MGDKIIFLKYCNEMENETTKKYFDNFKKWKQSEMWNNKNSFLLFWKDETEWKMEQPENF